MIIFLIKRTKEALLFYQKVKTVVVELYFANLVDEQELKSSVLTSH